MKVLHVIPSLSPKHGGPSFCVPVILDSLIQAGVTADLATTDDDGPGCRISVPLGRRLEGNGYGMVYFPKQTEFYKASFPFHRWVAKHVSDYDLICIHAVFSFTTTSAARHARRRGVPYLIVPHGILNRWGMENRRRFIKSISFRFVERPLLDYAAAMHYTSHNEQREAEQTGATAPGAVIPLGMNLGGFQCLPGPEIFLERFPQAKGRTLVLFLSRLDPKKGLDLLLPVFAEVRRKHSSAMLVIAGDGEKNFVAGLHVCAARLGLTNDILWTGFLSGADKLSAFAAASVFMLPSYSENFGIALIEAMAAGLPCLTTPGVAAAADIHAYAPDTLMVVPAEQGPLATALDQLLRNAVLRTQLGAAAKRLAFERFTVSAMGAALKEFYAGILSTQTAARLVAGRKSR